MKRLCVALGAATLLLSGTAAMAEPGADVSFGPAAVTVRTSDLDLATAKGRAALNLRVANAAESVCGKGLERVHLLLAAEAGECRAEVIASLAPRIEALTGKRPSVKVEVASSY